MFTKIQMFTKIKMFIKIIFIYNISNGDPYGGAW